LAEGGQRFLKPLLEVLGKARRTLVERPDAVLSDIVEELVVGNQGQDPLVFDNLVHEIAGQRRIVFGDQAVDGGAVVGEDVDDTGNGGAEADCLDEALKFGGIEAINVVNNDKEAFLGGLSVGILSGKTRTNPIEADWSGREPGAFGSSCSMHPAIATPAP
jgi:hypothetical protein